MTVEIDQYNQAHIHSPPLPHQLQHPHTSHQQHTPHGSIGSPSLSSPTSVSQQSGAIGSPTTPMTSAPTPNDSIINRQADPSQGLYQTCLTLRERLKDVPDFEKFLQPPADADPNMPEDPVTQLWRCFRMGSSLCVLFNATRPVMLIKDERLSPNLKTMNDCKAATFHFLKGIKEDLHITDENAFMIHNLYSDDTNGFVKVTRTVSKILDILKARNLLLNRGNSETNDEQGEKKPMDSRDRVVKELVDTERKYVQDLETLQEYMRALEGSEILSKDQIHNLFLNLNNLVDFQRRFLIRVETQNDRPSREQNWGSLFVQYEKSFSVYEPYAANLHSALQLASDERDRLAEMPHPVQEQLTAFLIKPVQRITKYPLLMKDMIKHTDPAIAEEQQLPAGLEAIERIAVATNEATRRIENQKVVDDLEGRVEDWKGHKLEHFGDLMLHGQFSVTKGDQRGDTEREYYIYLFERILLCCKEVGANKKQGKTMSMAKGTKGAPPKKKTMLQLKGRIFMQNVTDVISLARNGTYTLQIFWRGDPGVENFIIRHGSDESLQSWKKALEKQRQLFSRVDATTRARSTMNSTAATQFAWMHGDTGEGPLPQNDSDPDEETDDPTAYAEGGVPMLSTSSRNGSSTNLRSRSTTESAQSNSQSSFPRPPLSRLPLGHTPPLTLNTNPALHNLAHSPDYGSYFSPVETPAMASGRSSSGQHYPFPPQIRQQSGYYPDDPNRYTPPSMSRTPSREGASISVGHPQQYTAYSGGVSRLQRPSLPGMVHSSSLPGQPANNSQTRMRSASSPNIHQFSSSNLSRVSPGGNIPPVPSLPGTYQAYSGGPAPRSQTSSPTSPSLPIQGAVLSRNPSPAIDPGRSQIKVIIRFKQDELAIVVPSSVPYAQLVDRVERKVAQCPSYTGGPIKIKYQDEDGDYVRMGSDDDVQMVFDQAVEAGMAGEGEQEVVLFVYLVKDRE